MCDIATLGPAETALAGRSISPRHNCCLSRQLKRRPASSSSVLSSKLQEVTRTSFMLLVLCGECKSLGLASKSCTKPSHNRMSARVWLLVHPFPINLAPPVCGGVANSCPRSLCCSFRFRCCLVALGFAKTGWQIN